MALPVVTAWSSTAAMALLVPLPPLCRRRCADLYKLTPPPRLPQMSLAHVRRGSGPPLVLIHGIGSQWQMWQPVLDRVSREREVVALDLPGFGDSEELPRAADGRGAGRRGRPSSSTGSGWAARTWRATRSAAASRSRWRARARRARPALLSPAGFVNDREGIYARARAASSPAASRSSLRPLRRARCAAARCAARSRSATSSRGRGGSPPTRPRARCATSARSPGFEATFEAIEDFRCERPGRRAARSPSPGATRTALLIYSRQSARARAAAARARATSRSPAAATSRPGTTRSRSRGCCWRRSSAER